MRNPTCQICGQFLSTRRIVLNLLRSPRRVEFVVHLISGQTDTREVAWLCGGCQNLRTARSAGARRPEP